MLICNGKMSHACGSLRINMVHALAGHANGRAKPHDQLRSRLTGDSVCWIVHTPPAHRVPILCERVVHEDLVGIAYLGMADCAQGGEGCDTKLALQDPILVEVVVLRHHWSSDRSH